MITKRTHVNMCIKSHHTKLFFAILLVPSLYKLPISDLIQKSFRFCLYKCPSRQYVYLLIIVLTCLFTILCTKFSLALYLQDPPLEAQMKRAQSLFHFLFIISFIVHSINIYFSYLSIISWILFATTLLNISLL